MEKNGRSYFLKEFLAPKYPTDDSPGSARVKKEKRQRCDRFEQHHARLRKELKSACAPGGNLVYTIDFFREGAKYYKVTEKVDCVSLRPEQIARLPLEGRDHFHVTGVAVADAPGRTRIGAVGDAVGAKRVDGGWVGRVNSEGVGGGGERAQAGPFGVVLRTGG